MKKTTFITAFVLLLTILLGITVSAAAPTASLTASSSGVNAGGTVMVTVKVTCSSASLGIIPSYDTSVFELVSGEWLASGAVLSDFSDGCAVIAYAGSNNFKGDVFKFVLKAKSNAKVGSYTVKCEIQAEGYSATNPSCTVSVICKHTYGKWSQTDANKHTRTCSKCNETEIKTHTFDNACDADCNDCGYTRTVTHKYKAEWSSDGTSHWHSCSVCGAKKDETKHTPGAEATEEHAQTCTVCGYVIKKALTHTHTLETSMSFNENGHGYKCTKCGEIANIEAHQYENDCDTDCNVCGFVRSVTHRYSNEYTSDETGHWYACTVCGDKKTFETHIPGPEPTEESPQVCTVCGFVIKAAKDHEHIYSGEYKANEDGHWKCCTCGEESEHQAHIWNNGTVVKDPTVSENGTKVYKCSECGYEKNVELELVKDSAESKSEKDTSDDSAGSGISPLLAGGIGAGGMLLLCLIPIFALIKKKK